jgi:hypothetical protein
VIMSLVDRSLYCKGLMLLIRKDGNIRAEEKSMMKHLGKILGFEEGFCENTIDGLIENKHIIDSPPVFSEPRIALCFIRDGLRLSACDGQIHREELAWLGSVAKSNGLSCLTAKDFEKLSLSHRAESIEDGLELKDFS